MSGASPTQRSEDPSYGAIPVEEQRPDHTDDTQDGQSNHSQDHDTEDKGDGQQNGSPEAFDDSRLTRGLRLAFDLVVATLALLFAVFGIWVRKIDGTSADPGSIGVKLFQASQYGPTIFPVLFAAIAGASMKSVASWRIQAGHGVTVGVVEQCLGSQTISSAFLTQFNLRAFNLLGAAIVALWCLSPLGSQASLRVISIVPSHPATEVQLVTKDAFKQYGYSTSQGTILALGITPVTSIVAASMQATGLLQTRNQDLWGNVRCPIIGALEDGDENDWIALSGDKNVTYASLVGKPVTGLSAAGNTSFILPSSYLSVTCPVIKFIDPKNVTNIARVSTEAHDRKDGKICGWVAGGGIKAFSPWQIAISMPCLKGPGDKGAPINVTRKLVWESSSLAPPVYRQNRSITRAECALTTSYTETEVVCTGSSSGRSSESVCTPSAVRRSPNPPRHANTTVFDLGGQGEIDIMLKFLGSMFQGTTDVPEAKQPVPEFVGFPQEVNPEYVVPRSTLELGLTQLLNTALFVGAGVGDYTGKSVALPIDGLNMTGTAKVRQDIVHCNRAWLAVLIVTSMVTFACAVAGAVLRMLTMAPDVLGSISVAFLQNQLDGVRGSSAWSFDKWARENKDTRLYLGDQDPSAETGRIALVTSGEAPVSRVQPGRLYA